MNDTDLSELAASVSYAEPDRDTVEQMRTAVLASMGPARERAPASRGRWIAAFGLAAAAAAAFVLLHRGTPPGGHPAPHASVVAVGAATFEHARVASDETIRLTDGVVQLDVTPLAVGERCRVLTSDGEVEVRGTAFEVEAHHDHLARVAVAHGRVEVRTGGAVIVLTAGQRWVAPVQVVDIAPAIPAPTRSPSVLPSAPPSSAGLTSQRPRRATVTTAPSASAEHAATAHASPREAEQAFRAGWALLHTEPARAAEEFARAILLAPAGGVAEDATYWRAVALEQAHDSDAARASFAAFVDAFPGSVRAGEASLRLGLLSLSAGDRRGAERALRRATLDPSARVRDEARAGLAKLEAP